MRRTAIAALILIVGVAAGLVAGFYYFGKDRATYIRTTAPLKDLVTDIGNCTAKELTVSYVDNNSAPIINSANVVVRLNNVSPASHCSLNGDPVVKLTDAVGNQLGRSATRVGASNQEVSLNPGEQAELTVHLNTDVNQTGEICTDGIAQLRVNLPNNANYLSIGSKTTLWCPGFTTTGFSKV